MTIVSALLLATTRSCRHALDVLLRVVFCLDADNKLRVAPVPAFVLVWLTIGVGVLYFLWIGERREARVANEYLNNYVQPVLSAHQQSLISRRWTDDQQARADQSDN